MPGRSERLAAARLYLVCDVMPDAFLDACLGGGVEIVQLRAKTLDDDALCAAAERAAAVCRRHDVPFILNDRPDLVAAVGADGVHVGQDDAPVGLARELVGPDRIVGLSTHTPEQVDAGCLSGADYIGVGPVHATPTKPGRPEVGCALVAHAARRATLPFFAIGGIDRVTIGPVVAAGASRVAVVRALTDAEDPADAARALRRALADGGAVPVGAGAGQREVPLGSA